MSTANIYSHIKLADINGASSKLEELTARGLASSDLFELSICNKCLRIKALGRDFDKDVQDELNKCLTELAPFIKDNESFYIYFEEYDCEVDKILYQFKDKAFRYYNGKICFPDYRFFPLTTEEVINSIKSNPALLEAINESMDWK